MCCTHQPYIERAFRLAASIDRKQKGVFVEIITYVEDILDRFRNDNGFLLEKLMGLLAEALHCILVAGWQ